MSNLARAESIAFNEDFIRMEQAEKDADERDRLIEDRLRHELSEAGEFYPFTNNNIMEALCNMNTGMARTVCAFIATAEKVSTNDFAQAACAMTIRQAIRDYWTDVARAIIEKEMK